MYLLPQLDPNGVSRGLIKPAIPIEYNNIKKFYQLLNNTYRGFLEIRINYFFLINLLFLLLIKMDHFWN